MGILSDSYNRLNGQAVGIASGDLPAAGVQVIQELPVASGSGADEGRAMAEIIYDVAPGAEMAFNTAFTGEAGFAQGIINLAAAGCQIIVDDVGYLNAPMFQDGLVAQAVNQVVNNNGVTYFSAAANQARSSYQAPYKSGGTYTNATFYGTNTAYPTHNFAASGVDNLQQITVPNNGTLRLAFQWDNPYQSVSGGTGATTDLDILILNSTTGAILASGARDQSAGGDPWEITGTYTNTSGAARNVNVIIVKYSGPDPGLIKWVNYGSRTIIPEYDTKSSTSFGQANAAGAIGVGAAAYFQTPVFNGQPTATIETFSSAGGTPILFNTDGTRINGIIGTVRQKPEITSVDGGDNTFFGGDYEPNGKPNFFGTSAAAPHAAAVAALMKEKVPTITRSTILSTLESTALDMDDPSTTGFDAGFDFGTGYGFIQADRALQAITPTALTLVVSANPTMILTTGTTTLSATVSGGTTPYSYTFSGPGAISQSPGSNTASVSGLTAGVQTFTVVAKDATTPTSQSISGTVSVTVTNPTPTIASLGASPNPVCAGSPVSFTATIGSITTSYSYTLSNGTNPETGSSSNAAFSQSLTASGSGVQTYTLTVSSGGYLTTATTSLTVNTPPSAPTLTGVSRTVTQSNTPLQLSQFAQADNGNTLSFSGVNGAIANPPTADISQPGVQSFSVTQTNASGCVSPATPFTITVQQSATTTPGSQTVCRSNPVVLNATTTGVRYEWYKNGTSAPFKLTEIASIQRGTATSSLTVVSAQTTASYYVKVFQANGSFSFDGPFVVTVNYGCTTASARVSAAEVPLSVVLTPNPVLDGQLRAVVRGAGGQALSVELLDLRGQVVRSQTWSEADANQMVEWSIGQQATGLYLLKAQTPGQLTTVKLIKQ